jgi:hypothetical protein
MKKMYIMVNKNSLFKRTENTSSLSPFTMLNTFDYIHVHCILQYNSPPLVRSLHVQ